jgi:hypothetical protein
MFFLACVSIVFWWTIYDSIKLAMTLTIVVYIYGHMNKPSMI